MAGANGFLLLELVRILVVELAHLARPSAPAAPPTSASIILLMLMSIARVGLQLVERHSARRERLLEFLLVRKLRPHLLDAAVDFSVGDRHLARTRLLRRARV